MARGCRARSCARTAPRAWLPTRFQRRWRWWRGRCRARDRASCCEGSCDEGRRRITPRWSGGAGAQWHRSRGRAASTPPRSTGAAAPRTGRRRRAAGCAARRRSASSGRRCRTGWCEAIEPQHGQRVLELAAGLGETGLLAAELVAPTGGVILSDHAEAMLEGARARAAKLELTNVEFQVWNAEWIDLPVASVDAVLCRWGYMLMADPLAALRRDAPRAAPGRARRAGGVGCARRQPVGARAAPGAAGARAGAAAGRVRRVHARPVRARRPRAPARAAGRGRLHRSRGRGDRRGAAPRLLRRPSGRRCSTSRASCTTSCSPGPRPRSRRSSASLAARLAPYTAPDGALEIPGRSLVAVAFA